MSALAGGFGAACPHNNMNGSAEEKLTGGPTPSPPDAAAYFLDLKDGTLQRRELEAASGSWE
jgi:hypothetical protein